MRRGIRKGAFKPGGIVSYPLDELYREVAYIAYYFHWPHEEVMNMEHPERRRWVKEIAAINREINQEEKA